MPLQNLNSERLGWLGKFEFNVGRTIFKLKCSLEGGCMKGVVRKSDRGRETTMVELDLSSFDPDPSSRL